MLNCVADTSNFVFCRLSGCRDLHPIRSEIMTLSGKMDTGTVLSLSTVYFRNVLPEKGTPQLLSFPVPASRHRASFRNVIPLSAAQGLAAEIPAGGRPVLINCTAPDCFSAAVRFVFLQMPAGGIDKKITIGFPHTTLAEVVQVVRFAFPD
jgi:hypothetical protein